MGYLDLSKKNTKLALDNITRNGGGRCSFERKVRGPTVLQCCLLAIAFSLNILIMVKYSLPWLLSPALLSSEAAGAPPVGLRSNYKVAGIKSGENLLHMQWPVQAYKTERFLAPEMRTSKKGKTVEGLLFITPWGNGTSSDGPAIMTERNDLVWHGPTGDTTNFRVQSLHGNAVATFWKGSSTATFGHGYGGVHILDNTYTEIGRVCMKNLDLNIPNHDTFPCFLDMHESYLTDRGTLIATAYNVTKYDLSPVGGPKDGFIFDSLFYEIDIKTEKVLFRWRSLDHMKNIPLTDSHYPLKSDGTSYGRHQRLPWDYFHINSVQPLDDGGYLVNGRHTFSVYKVSSEGHIEWVLQGLDGGDFTLGPGIRFTWQHMPRIISTCGSKVRMTLYNNDNSEADRNEGRHQTTALDLTLNLDSMKALLNSKLVPEDPIYSASQGSNQLLENGHSLVGYGQIAALKEYNATGDVVYTARFGASTAELLVASYRAYRYPWVGNPKQEPKVLAEPDGNLTHVYMSWNGATDVHRWVIYAGQLESKMEPVAIVQKAGFETQVSLPAKVKYIQAEALRRGEETGAGGSSAKSKIERVKPAQ